MNDPMSVDDMVRLVEHFGPEPGWTDTVEHIRDEHTEFFRVLGRWFLKTPKGCVPLE